LFRTGAFDGVIRGRVLSANQFMSHLTYLAGPARQNVFSNDLLQEFQTVEPLMSYSSACCVFGGILSDFLLLEIE